MAVRISTDASAIKRSANTPSQTAFTLGGWFYFNSATPARFWGPLGLYAGTDGSPTSGTDYVQISSASSGSAVLEIIGGTYGAGQTLITAKAATWYFLAMTGTALGAGGLVGWARAHYEKSFTQASNINTGTAFTSARMEWGRDAFTGDPIDGAAEHCFCFDRALGEAELMKLSNALLAERVFPDRTNLNVYYRFRGAHDTQDLSGNARALTATLGLNAAGLRVWPRRKPVIASPAATGAIAGTAAWTWGQTGVLLGDGALAGSSAWTWGQTGALRGSGALAGSIPWTWAQTAALKGAGALASTVAWTWNQSGDLKGAGALAGTIPWVWNQSGDLTNSTPLTGAISGTTSWTWGQSADLKGAGALASSVSWTWNQSATLLGVGTLAGTIAWQWSQTGAVAGSGTLAGSVAWVWSQTADLTNSTLGAIVGTASWVWGVTGTLTDASPAASTPIGGVRGPGLFHHFEEHRRKLRRELEEIEARERDTQEIADDVDRQIAEQFRIDELRQAKLAEKERLQRLADAFANRPLQIPAHVVESIARAAEQRTLKRLLKMQSDIVAMYRAQEMEAVAIAVLLLDDD